MQINPFSVGRVPEDAEVVFVADYFANELIGGAELTTDALVKSSPFRTFCVKSKDVGQLTVESGKNKFWVVCNFGEINSNALKLIASNCRYVVLEYDYKFCKYRSPEKHAASDGICDCENSPLGIFVDAMYKNAKCVFWMSEAQKSVYDSRFENANSYNSVVLSSVFGDEFFAKIALLRRNTEKKTDSYVVLDSKSWIKGTSAAVDYCEQSDLKYELIGNVSYDVMLQKLASSKGLVYLPPGGDTCPRMVIEAKLLGCDLILNDNVQHAKEDWFVDEDLENVEAYLYKCREVFWNEVRLQMNKKPTLSGYVTTRNCVAQGYPFLQCVKSLLAFCDEVCIVDSGSTDGTLEQLRELASVTPEGRLGSAIKIRQVDLDWNNPRFAVYDGMNKATAREMCSGDFCWQQDSDEIVDVSDTDKIKSMLINVPSNGDYVIALPVVEYWGGPDKIRVDVNPWKWRLSPNSKNITHGIPMSLRRLDSDGNLCAAQGTDGCDMISKDTFEPITTLSFYSQQVHECKIAAQQGIAAALNAYSKWLEQISNELPTIYHYSWFDIGRKIRLYKDYWTKHWNSLYDEDLRDTAETNMFFDSAWKDVSEKDIDDMSVRLKNETGGWIFHNKWRGQRIPHVSFPTKNPIEKY